GLVSNNNALTGVFTIDDGGSSIDFPAWKAATGGDAQSLTSTLSALFLDPAHDVYHLAAASPALDSGSQAFAPQTDLNGTARPFGLAPDIGAFESTTASAVPRAPAGLNAAPISST